MPPAYSEEQMIVLKHMRNGRLLFIDRDGRGYVFTDGLKMKLDSRTALVLIREKWVKKGVGYSDAFPVYELSEEGYSLSYGE